MSKLTEKLEILRPAKRVLAVEMIGDEIRAALVRKRRGAFEVVDFAAMKRLDARDELPDVAALKALAERLKLSSAPAVLVTPLARAFEMFMDRRKISKMKHYQLIEAAKWEVEPYTGISGANALIGVAPNFQPPAGPGEIISEDEDSQIAVTVTAIERNVYRAVRERMKAAGLTLVHIFPQELTFYYALFLESLDHPRAIFEVGQEYSNFAILQEGIPEQVSTLNLSVEAITAHLRGESVSRELEDTLVFMAQQVPESEPLVIAGPGATDEDVVEFISGFCPSGSRILEVSRTAGVAESKGDTAGVVFGTVVGAAVRELKGRVDRQAGITDRTPLIPRLKKNANVVPLAVTVGLMLILAGHYQYMKYQDRVYKDRTQTLKNELKERKAEIAKYQKLLSEVSTLKKEIDLTQRRLIYIEGQADVNLEHVIACVNGMADALSDQIVLNSIRQIDKAAYVVTGAAYDLEALGIYTAQLQQAVWCKAVVVNKIQKTSGENRMDFELAVKAQDGVT